MPRPLVSVVLDPGYDDELRAVSLRSLEGQTLTDWEVVTGLAEATGEYVAFLDAGDSWVPDRLERLTALGRAFVADELEGERGNGEKVVFRTPAPDVEPARLVAQREAMLGLGPVDPGLPAAWLLDLLMRHGTGVDAVPVVGVRRRFPDRRRALHPPPGDWRRVVLNKHLVDWAALGARVPTAGLTSVIVPTYDDSELTTACVESLLADTASDRTPLEVIVWDNGSSAPVAAQLDRLAGGTVQVHRSAENHGFALGNNLALAHATGDVVVFLNNDTTVPSEWLAPLREALTDDDVLAAQPLLLYPSGAVQSAGVVFPTCGGLPHAFLQGFPAEDADGVEGLRLQALTGAALALRHADAVALRGFDPVFTNGMEDVDLCHRLAQRRDGHFRVVGTAPVVHHESRTPGRYDKHLANRRIYLDRWQRVVAPRDDAALWATRGLRVVDHEIGPARHGEPPRLRIPRPVLVREARMQVTGQPRLRWAIKNPAPAGTGGERWGDTHFAAALAAALREQGQEVVIDRRPEWDRPTGRHDDVVLVLRGLFEHEPSPEQVSLLWVISHPELVSREEVQGYDRVLAAGRPWADRRALDWAVPVEPLLQATDPGRFHPDAAAADSGDPVLFVGNSRRVLRPVVRDALAAGLPLAVYGDLWSGLVPDEVVRGRSLPNEALAAAYRSAGVVLNDHHEGMRADGFVSNRLFDAVASGARVITDPVDGLGELFGPSVQVYETVEDLQRLATLPEPDAVFGDDATRRAAADRVRSEHSFAARAVRLVEIAHEAQAARTPLSRNTEVTRGGNPLHARNTARRAAKPAAARVLGIAVGPRARTLAPVGGSVDGYYAFMLVATALVLMMTIPALALFYGGMSRSKSVLNMMMMSYVAFAVAAIVFVLWGWSEGWAGAGNGKLIGNPFELFGLDGVDWQATADSTGSPYVGVLFQLTFAAITVALISGAIADRVKLSSWIVFVPFWLTLCYFPIAHNTWGGGWLYSHLSQQDYAGGTVVHINAGIAGGVLALIIGRRVGFGKEPMRPHNLTLTMLGAGLLWFGWYGFNVGSIVFTSDDPTAQFMSETGFTFMNTTIATCAAMLGWLVMERIMHGKATSLGAASGIVAGLVAITPSCGAVSLSGAIAIGAIAGIVCAWAVGLKYRFGLDDSLDVVGVHLVGGVLGTVLIGFLSTADAPGGINGLFYGGGWKSLGDQAGAAGFTILWTGVLTTVIALAIKYTIGWRVPADGEVEGIDSDQHGETAYDLHSGLGGGGSKTATSVLAKPATTPAVNEGANA